jgi:hypothetical protein
MAKVGRACKILTETPGERKIIGRTRRRCENNIKIVLQDTVCGLD